VNSDLIGKYVNIASRAAPFIHKHFSGKVRDWGLSGAGTHPIIARIESAEKEIAGYYEGREFGRAVRRIMELSDEVNKYFDEEKPWELAKKGILIKLHEVCSVSLEAFRLLTIYLAPILPNVADAVAKFLKASCREWRAIHRPLTSLRPIEEPILPYSHLMTRVDPRQLDALFEIEKEPAKVMPSTPHPASPAPGSAQPAAAPATISIDEFAKIDLRIAKIVKAENVEGADKLLKLTLDVGGDTRTVFAGIKSAYDPAALEGRLTVVVANLAPRKMKFGLSQGMILAASGEGPGLYLLAPDSGAQPGMKVK